MMEKRVVITGMAVISPVASGLREFWENIKKGNSGIKRTDAHDIGPASCPYAGLVEDCVEMNSWGRMGKFLAKSTKMFASVCVSALKDADYISPEARDGELGMIAGSAFGNYEKTMMWYKKYAEDGYDGIMPMDSIDGGHNSSIDHISILIKATGIHKMMSTGIASSLDAIGNAYQYIKNGRSQIILAGGYESIFKEMIYFFGAKKLLAFSDTMSENSIKPFDENRSGILLGEGYAALILEDIEHAKNRNAGIYAEITGYGSGFMNRLNKSNSKEINRRGSIPMAIAMQNAKMAPDDIDYVCASANGSRDGDFIEAHAIQDLFQSRKAPIPVTSIKGNVGECYGVSGAMQSISAVFSMHDGVIPRTKNCSRPLLNDGLAIVVNENIQRNIDRIMINSFDCFGCVSSLIIGKYP